MTFWTNYVISYTTIIFVLPTMNGKSGFTSKAPHDLTGYKKIFSSQLEDLVFSVLSSVSLALPTGPVDSFSLASRVRSSLLTTSSPVSMLSDVSTYTCTTNTN